jgi:hypothetical protein
MVTKLRDVDLDALTSGSVEEAVAARRGELLLEHGPPPWMEPAVQTAVGQWLGATLTPGATHGAEAHIAGDVKSEDALGDDPRGSVIKTSPVPLAKQRKIRSKSQSCFRPSCEEEEMLLADASCVQI